MFALAMNQSPSRIPVLITVFAGCLLCVGIVIVKVAAQTSQPESVSFSMPTNWAQWILSVGGAITMAAGIIYGLFKKQKYENLTRDRDEWKDLAETREERIKELRYASSEAEAKLKLIIAHGERSIENLSESNSALVSQSLQMKAILRGLRLKGVWNGDEERIHETQ